MKTKKTNVILITAMTFAMFFVAMLSFAYAADQGKQAEKAAMIKTHHAMKSAMVKVSGIIVANKNKKGKIVSYALQEDGGQALLLSKHGKGMELRKMVGSKVEATGAVKEIKHGKMIIVKEFKKIE
jgi:hypothetical protein